MGEVPKFANPLVIEADHYYRIRTELDAYAKAIDHLDLMRERRHQYLRGISKSDLEVDEARLLELERDIEEAAVEVVGVRQDYFNNYD